MNRQLSERESRRLGAQLVCAAEQAESEEAIRLLESGADPDSVDESGTSAMAWAARRGDVRLIDELLRRGAKVDAVDAGATTPLMWAIREGHGDAAERLLAAGADVRLRDAKGHTVLHFAAARGNMSLVERLLMRGAVIDVVDDFEDTPLTLAAAGAHFDMAMLLAERGADINAQGNGGRTALLLAVMENRLPAGEQKAAVLRQLVERGADVEIADDYGWTPLMRAAYAGDEAVVRLLLDRGVDIHRTDGQGLTAFHWAAQSGHTDVMRLLLDRGADVDTRDSQGQTALFRQMRDPNPETVRWLLSAGASPNSRNDRGDTVLIAAVRKQNEEMAALLLKHGADIQAASEGGKTPLDIALQGGMEQLAHFLIEKGARSTATVAESLLLTGGIDEPDDRGWTPLGKAARDNDLGRVHLLLDAGANVEAAAVDGVTPIMIAAERSSEGTLSALLARGADVKSRDARGDSVLHHAVAGQRPENVGALLEAGADVDAMGNGGRTPLMAAIAQYDNQIAWLLLDAGADVDLLDEQGRTALVVAVSHRNEEMVSRLLQLGADTLIEDREGRTAADVAVALNEPDLARRVETAATPVGKLQKPAIPDTRQWPVPESVMEGLAMMFPEDSAPAHPVVPTQHPAGYVLDPEREVDCGCDVRFHRPVLHDPTGRNLRVTACLKCGTVTVTEAIVDEPHPNDVWCVGNVIHEVAAESLAWLAEWPRLAWGVWNDDRSIYLPAALRCQTVEGLEQEERAALTAQQSMGLHDRLLFAGVPTAPAPSTLPESLARYAETWEGLQLADDTPVERLWSLSRDGNWAAPFAHALLLQQPNIIQETATRLRSADTDRFRAAKCLVDRQRLSDPAIVAAIVDRIREAPLTEASVGPLLDTIYFIGAAAAEARPLLKDLARRVGDRDYYFRKRILQVHDLIAPGPGGGG